MRHLELFAGIGGFRRAMELLERDCRIPFPCVGFSEIDAKAKLTYTVNFDTAGEVDMGDIVAFNQEEQRIRELPDFDLLTGGFPCQAFSMMGKKLGFEDDRGNLFFNIAHILEIRQPRFVLLENVRNLLTHDGGRTFAVVSGKLRELGYQVFYDIFNTADFGLAQTRKRIIIFATRAALPEDFVFTSAEVKQVFARWVARSGLLRQQSVADVLEETVPAKYYLSERVKPTILNNGTGKFQSKSEINQIIARPLTATMAKMHRACQDNYYSDGFLRAEDKAAYNRIEFTKEELMRQPIRKLTPQEAMALQGFSRDFCENAMQAGVANGHLYKQAGNAVSVNTIYAILYYLFVNRRLA